MVSRYESDRTRKEKRELERQKLSQMGLKEKLQYIWAYYKPAIFGVIGVIAAIFIILDIRENNKYYDLLSIAVANSSAMDSTDEAQATLKELLGTGDKYERVGIDTSYSFGENMDNAEYNTVMKLTAVIAAKSLDVLICNEGVYDHYEEQDFFLDLSTLFDEATCEKYGIQPGDKKLDVSKLPNYQGLGLTAYEPAYLTVIVNSEHTECVKEFIQYLEEGQTNE